jgi:hypothetical protein
VSEGPDSLDQNLPLRDLAPKEWYYSQQGVKVGPVYFGDLEALAASGELKRTDLVYDLECEESVLAETLELPFSEGLDPGEWTRLVIPIADEGELAYFNTATYTGPKIEYASIEERLGAYLVDAIIFSCAAAGLFIVGAIIAAMLNFV